MFFKSFLEYQLKRDLKHLIVHVTNHCNFRCEHCFIDFSTKRDLTLEKYQELGRDVGPLFWLDLAGGEPFIRKDLVQICEAFSAEVVTIPTNGFFVDKVVEMSKQVRDRIPGELTIAISLDGLQQTHDKIREAGSWDKAWETFEKLKSLGGIRVKINTVICEDNFDEILPLMEFVYTQRPDFHSMILLRGDPINPAFKLPQISELKDMQTKIFEILGKYDYGHGKLTSRFLRNYHRYQWNTSLATIEKRTQVIPCLAGKAHAVIMGNGDVSSCEMLKPIGNVNEKSWKEIWKGEQMKQQRKYIKDKRCHCTHNCALLDSILFRPQAVAQLLQGVELEKKAS